MMEGEILRCNWVCFFGGLDEILSAKCETAVQRLVARLGLGTQGLMGIPRSRVSKLFRECLAIRTYTHSGFLYRRPKARQIVYQESILGAPSSGNSHTNIAIFITKWRYSSIAGSTRSIPSTALRPPAPVVSGIILFKALDS